MPGGKEVALISGASSGFGAACARGFAVHGWRLVLCARRLDRLNALAEDLERRSGTESLCLELDVRRYEAVQAALAGLPQGFREIDLLINNAGLAAGKDKLFEADVADWEQMIDTNIKGLLYLTRLVVPGMIERGRGHVINIGSIAGYEPYSGGSVYCGTKFAERAISRALKMDLQGTPVRVSSVDPGMADTEFSQVRFKGDRTRADEVYRGMQPLSADDVADAVYYCASRPAHVNINQILLMPTAQAGATDVHRGK